MTADTLDPLIHVPARLQIVATLAALPDGDALSFTRLQDMIGLTPGNLITHLRKLEEPTTSPARRPGAGRRREPRWRSPTGDARPWMSTKKRCAPCSTAYRDMTARETIALLSTP
jgi:hypothetical protein